MRKRWERFARAYDQLRVRGVDEESAIIIGCRSAFSQRLTRNADWCLRHGRGILRVLRANGLLASNSGFDGKRRDLR